MSIDSEDSIGEQNSTKEKTDDPSSLGDTSRGLLPRVVIKTSFGSSVAEKTTETPVAKEEPIPKTFDLSSKAEATTSKEEQTEPTPIICPRATMELSHAHDLLTSIRYAFKEEAKEIQESLDKYETVKNDKSLKSTTQEQGELETTRRAEEASVSTFAPPSSSDFVDTGFVKPKIETIRETAKEVTPTHKEQEPSQPEPVVISLQSHNPDRLTELMQMNHEDEKPQVQSSDQSPIFLSNEPVKALDPEGQQLLITDGHENQDQEQHREDSVGSSLVEVNEDGDFWSKCSTLAETGEWGTINEMASQQTGVCDQEKKYWWMRANKELGSLSSSLLTAPLQELLRELEEGNADAMKAFTDPRKRAALESLGREVLTSAIGEGQGAAQIFDLMNRLKPLSHEEASWRKEEDTLLDALNSKESFERSEAENTIVEELSSRPKSKTSEGTKGGFQFEDAARSSAETVLNSNHSGFNKESKSGGASLLASVSIPRVSKRAVYGVGIALALFALSFTVNGFLGPHSSHQIESNLYTALPTDPPLLQPPSQKELDTRIFKGMLLDAGGAGRSSVKKTTVSSPVSSNNLVAEYTNEVVRKEQLGSQAHGMVNTDGPIEPEGLFDQRDSPAPDRNDAVISRNYVKGLGADMISKKRGKPLSVSKEPKLFTVTVDTNVLSAPSLDSRVLERIQRGVKVRVIRRFGDWLLLRSHDGQPGYILKRDAIETGLSRS